MIAPHVHDRPDDKQGSREAKRGGEGRGVGGGGEGGGGGGGAGGDNGLKDAAHKHSHSLWPNWDAVQEKGFGGNGGRRSRDEQQSGSLSSIVVNKYWGP